MSLPGVPSVELILQRLPIIFPEGLEDRSYCIREAAARTIVVMLYAGAIEGADRWVKPSQVVNMSADQLANAAAEDREAWFRASSANRLSRPQSAWYAANSREQVRDETLRSGLVRYGAVIEKPGVPTTSSKGRYALTRDFASLFSLELASEELDSAAAQWRSGALSPGALARITLLRSGAAEGAGRVDVRLPNGRVEILDPGPSALLTKALVEEFAPRFLHKPSVLWLSESSRKVVDDALIRSLKMRIDPARRLPDTILADLGLPSGQIMLVFCEVVHTAGAITAQRKNDLEAIATDAGFQGEGIAYVTVLADRGQPQIRQQIGKIAWNTFIWFASEPDGLMELREGRVFKLSQLAI